MSTVGFALALLGLGVLLGVWLTAWVRGFWAASETGRRRQAVVDAENRVREAHASALNQMADAAADVIYDQTGQHREWPSDLVVEGVLVPTRQES